MPTCALTTTPTSTSLLRAPGIAKLTKKVKQMCVCSMMTWADCDYGNDFAYDEGQYLRAEQSYQGDNHALTIFWNVRKEIGILVQVLGQRRFLMLELVNSSNSR
jgi:hypothetical protein